MLSGPFKRQPFFWHLCGEKYDGERGMHRKDAGKCACVWCRRERQKIEQHRLEFFTVVINPTHKRICIQQHIYRQCMLTHRLHKHANYIPTHYRPTYIHETNNRLTYISFSPASPHLHTHTHTHTPLAGSASISCTSM